MSDPEFKDVKRGKVKTYTHEEHIIKDSKGKKCVIRCSFDEERFFLRSARFIDKKGAVYHPKLIISDIGTEPMIDADLGPGL